MKAIAVIGENEAATLKEVDVGRPIPDADQVLVRVRAAGLNRADLRRVQQHYQQDRSQHIAGLEFAGEVVDCGPGVSGFKQGDRVMAMSPNAYAEYALADTCTLLPVPESMEWPEAAAIPIWFMTAHNALVAEGGMGRGKTVLITAAASGVGIASIQIARLFGAERIIGTATSRLKEQRLRDIGLTDLIVPSEAPVDEQVQQLTGGTGVDIALDMIGRGLLAGLMRATALGGRIISVGRMGGFTDTIDLDKLALRRQRLIGVTFRTLNAESKAALRDATMRDLGPALSQGTLRPVVDRTFPLSQASEAQDYMKQNLHFGKIVLIP